MEVDGTSSGGVVHLSMGDDGTSSGGVVQLSMGEEPGAGEAQQLGMGEGGVVLGAGRVIVKQEEAGK